jgi:hypothetical protein
LSITSCTDHGATKRLNALNLPQWADIDLSAGCATTVQSYGLQPEAAWQGRPKSIAGGFVVPAARYNAGSLSIGYETHTLDNEYQFTELYYEEFGMS